MEYLTSEGRTLTDVESQLQRETELLLGEIKLLVEAAKRGEEHPFLEAVHSQVARVRHELNCVQDALGLTLAEDLEASLDKSGPC